MRPELLNLLIAAIGVLGSLTTFFLGRHLERRRQSLLVRAEMLDSVKEWVGGVERIMQMIADSMAAVEQGLLFPATYNPSERRQAAQFMGEKSREVIGILESGSLRTPRTKKLADQLRRETTLVNIALNKLMELETAILQLQPSELWKNENTLVAVELMNTLDSQVSNIHALIAKMKTSFV